MFCETFYTQAVSDWCNQSAKTKQMLWNEYFDATGIGAAIVTLDTNLDINMVYETDSGYKTALAQNRYNPSHGYFFIDKDDLATTFDELDSPLSPYNETAVLHHLKPIVLAEIMGKILKEQGDDKVLSFCQDYIESVGRAEIGINDLQYATSWAVKNKPMAWQSIYDQASLEVEQIFSSIHE